MFYPVWSRVVIGNYRYMPGVIFGVQRRCIREKTYPGLIETRESDSVNGLIYFDVSHEDICRLDMFEGNFYQRCKKPCKLEDGKIVDTDTYLFRKEFYHLLENKPWDCKWFETKGIYEFIRRYKGFETI